MESEPTQQPPHTHANNCPECDPDEQHKTTVRVGIRFQVQPSCQQVTGKPDQCTNQQLADDAKQEIKDEFKQEVHETKSFAFSRGIALCRGDGPGTETKVFKPLIPSPSPPRGRREDRIELIFALLRLIQTSQ